MFKKPQTEDQDNGDSSPLLSLEQNFIESRDFDNKSDTEAAFSIEETIRGALMHLSPQQIKVLGLRYGLEDGQVLKFSQVAQLAGMSENATRRIERSAIDRLEDITNLRPVGRYLYPGIFSDYPAMQIPEFAFKNIPGKQIDLVQLSPSFTEGLFGDKQEKQGLVRSFLSALGIR